MAFIAPSHMVQSDYALQAIAERIVVDTCADLKDRVMEIIEPQIDEACNRAALSLKPVVEAHVRRHFDSGFTEHIVKIITEKKSK